MFLAALGISCGMANAQLVDPLAGNSRPIVGGSGGLRPPSQLPVLPGGETSDALRHYGPTGKPCLRVDGVARPQLVNPKIFEHVISATNSCSERIKVQVCYYRTEDCVPLEVGGYGRKEVVLGIMPSMKEFRFEYREQFDRRQ